MNRPTRRSRASVAALATLALAVTVAVFTTIGYAGSSAIQYAPVNTALPGISGNATVGSTLTTTNGSWTTDGGNISYSYQWQRCDNAGNNCGNIPGATGVSYVLQAADNTKRVRSTVTARNNDGSKAATSGPTAVITNPGPVGQIKLANGQVSIPATSVSLPTRLVIEQIQFSQSPIRSRNPVQARFRIFDTRGFVVRDALVYATAIPFGRIVQPPEVRTDSNGWATMTIQPTRLLPLRNGFLLTMFLRVRKDGEDILAGVSSRRLISVRTANPA